MNTCGECKHFRSDRFSYFVCGRTGRPAGMLQEKKCFESKDMEENTKPQTKVCKRCGRELPVSEFNRHAKSRDGLQPFCKECQSDVNRDARQKKSLVTVENSGLSSFYDDQLVAELRKRGWRGTITQTIEKTL